MKSSPRLGFQCAFLAALFSLAIFAHAAGAVTRVACVGDSITYGSRLQERTLNCYPARLGRWLGSDYDVRNFGVSGATMLKLGDRPYDKQKDYAAALDFKPDILIISLGANDTKHPTADDPTSAKSVNNWQYKSNYVADYEAMIAAFRQADPAVKVYVCLPLPAFPGRYGINNQTIHEEVVPLVRQVAKESDAQIIDLNTPFASKGNLFSDTVHPTDEGAKFLAAEVYHSLTGQNAPLMPDLAEKLLANRRVLWLGDSITQDGKYVSFVEYYLDKDFPADNFNIISIGLASETVSGLSEKTHPFPRPCVFERLPRALAAVKPSTVIACYGMNDGIYHPESDERKKAFTDGIKLLSSTVESNRTQLILLTPPPFDAQSAGNIAPETAADFGYRAAFSNYDSVLADYSAWELSLPAATARLVVDFHGPVDKYIAAQRALDPKFKPSKDGIHPDALGHLLMAQTFLRAVGVDTGTNDLAAELARIQADPLFKLVNEHRSKRSAGWLESIGYTRGKTVKTNSIVETEATATAQQTKIDELRRPPVIAAK